MKRNNTNIAVLRSAGNRSGSQASASGSNNRGRGRGRGRATATRGLGYQPFETPNFRPENTIQYNGEQQDFDTALLENRGIQAIRFGSRFNVLDTHLAAISSRPALCETLQSLSLGDSDTGYGRHCQTQQ